MSIDNVTDITPRVKYTASASQTAFTYPFPIFDDADLVVDVNGATQVLTTNYTVSGAGDDTGGTVTRVTASTAGDVVTIYRDTAIERTSDYQQNGPLTSSVINDDFDKLIVIAQELDAKNGRALRIPVTAEVTDADIELDPANFANKYLAFDADGKPVPAAIVTGTQTQASIGSLLYPRTDAELAGVVTPQQYSKWSYDNTPYNDLWRYMTTAQINSIKSGGSVDTASGWRSAVAMMNKVEYPTYTANAGNGLRVIIPPGNYPVGSTITLPRVGAFVGAGSRRGVHGPTGGGFGCGVQATFAGPVFAGVEANLTVYDLLLEGFNVIGKKATYGAGHGILFTKTGGVKLRDMVVADFGTNNIHSDGAGSYGLELDFIYSATAGNANFYIASSDSTMHRCQSDGGLYSVYAAAGSDELYIGGGCHFEGPSVTIIHSLAPRLRVVGNELRSTIVAAVGGIYFGGSEGQCSGNELFATASSGIGIDVAAGVTGYHISDKVRGFATAVRLAEGAGCLGSGVYAGTTTGAELIGGTFIGSIGGGALISGPTHSLKHTSGTRKWRIRDVDLSDGAGVYKPMTLTAGIPLLEGLSPKPIVKVTNSAAQSVGSAAYTALTFDTESFDTDTEHSTSSDTSRLTARVDGKRRVSYSIQFASNSTGTRTGRVRKNGATLVESLPAINATTGGNDTTVKGSFIVEMFATEYVELEAYQDSGSPLNIQAGVGTTFEMELVGDA